MKRALLLLVALALVGCGARAGCLICMNAMGPTVQQNLHPADAGADGGE